MTCPFARKLCLAVLTALFGVTIAGGCAGIGATRASPGPTSRPSAWTSQRERELASKGWWGQFTTRIGWVFSDTADRISGTRKKLAEDLADKDNPDRRREGITGLVDHPYGEVSPYTVAYAAIVRDTSQEYLVRASALRALNRSRASEFQPLYLEQLTDSNEVVRLEACKALNRMPDVKAVPTLMQLAARPEENKDVRIAAVEALRHYKRLDVARALIPLLSEKEFGIAWQARRSLQDITHQKLGYDETKWLHYLSKPDKPLS
jgi:hypothetical protein